LKLCECGGSGGIEGAIEVEESVREEKEEGEEERRIGGLK
jgi:hypothetical protein